MAKKGISLLLVACVALLGSARSSALTQVSASAPTVTSDRQVYSPGDAVQLAGEGWSAGENIHLSVNDNVGNTWSWTSDVTADGDGAFSAGFSLPSSFVATYSVTATGGVSGIATTSFFDDTMIITGPTSANVGDTKSYSASKNGNGCDTTSGTWTIAPTGASIPSQTQPAASVQFDASGTYTLTSTWSGTNGGKNACIATGTLTIVVAAVAQPTSVSQISGAGTYAGTASLTATLKTDGTPVSGKTITFTLNGSAVGSAITNAAGLAVLGGVSLSGVNAGTVSGAVGASFAGDARFTASSGTGNLSVAPAPSTTTVDCPGTSLLYDGAAKTPCSASVSGVGGLSQTLPVAYSNNLGAGTATASASYAGDTNHTGSNDTKTFTIAKAQSATALTCPATVTYDGSPKTPCGAVVTGAGGLSQPVPVSYSNNADAGTAVANAAFAGDANHDGSSDSKTFGIARADQTITFDDAPFSASYGQAFQVRPTASSGLAVALSGTAGVCSVTADAIQPGAFDVQMLAGTGTCTLTASQSGTGNYNAAASVSRQVAAAKADQTISFDALADKTFGDAYFGLSASSSSGLAVAFAAGGNCSIDGSIVHILGAGGCTLTASQDGDGNYNAATEVARSFTIAKAASALLVTCAAGPYTYTGDAKTPCSAEVTGVGGLAQSLPVMYANNTDAGTATASAEYAGDANHFGNTGSATFTIDKAGSSTTVTCPDSRTYTGSAIEPCTASATGAGRLDAALAISYDDNVAAGTATAAASFAGDANHTGSSSSATFTIDKAPSAVAVTCPSSQVYTGSPIEPCSAKATGAGELDVDLDTTYAGNVAAGTATASATYAGDANHTGSSSSATFAIDKAPSTTTVTCARSQVYTGGAIEPCSAKVTGTGGLDAQLTVNYADNVGAGTATASTTYAGDANHTGSSGSATFAIDKAPSTTTVTCAGSHLYTGDAIKPCSARATGVGGLDTDVPVSYSDNVNAGTATASAEYAGDDNHTGSGGSDTFAIEKASSSVAVTCPDSRTFTGDPIEPCSADASGAGALDVALTVTYANNVDAGLATASSAYSGDSNHTGSSGSATFRIEKAPSHITVNCPAGPYVYTGSAHAPCSAKVTGAGGLDLTLPVAYTNDVDAGTATASASYDGDVNHVGDSASDSFTIEKAAAHVTVTCAAGPFIYGGSAQTPCSAKVTGAGALDQALVVTYSGNTAAGTATASAGFAGDANHTADSTSATFTIDKAPAAVAVSCPDSRVFTGGAIEPCTAKATGAGGLDALVAVSYAQNVNAGTANASATYTGDSNHFGSSGSATFTITKASSVVTVTCAVGPFTYNGAAQTPCSAKVTGTGGLDAPLPVNYSDNVNAGTATAAAAYEGDANHTSDGTSKPFIIGKATPTVIIAWNGWTYDGAAHPASGSVTGVGGASLGSPAFTYYVGSTASGTPLAGAPSGVGSYTVVAAYAGGANYLPASKTKTATGVYRWDGFLQPINDTAHQGLFESSFKLGSTVPAKFQLKKADGTVVQAGALPVFSRSPSPVSCDTQIAAEVLDGDAAFTGSTFRWDGSQYIYNWSTKGMTAGEYRIYATLDDGSKQYVDICLR